MTKVIKPNKKNQGEKEKKSEDNKIRAQEGGDELYFIGQTKAENFFIVDWLGLEYKVLFE